MPPILKVLSISFIIIIFYTDGYIFHYLLFLTWSHNFLRREINFQYSILRTYIHTLSAQTTLLKINICQIVFERNSLELTYLHALSATDTSHGTCIFRYWSFIFIHAADIYPAVHLVLITQFNDRTRTGRYAHTACRTFILIYLRKTCIRIHVDSIKLAGCHTVPAPQTSVRTASLSTGHHVSDRTTVRTVISVHARSVLA